MRVRLAVVMKRVLTRLPRVVKSAVRASLAEAGCAGNCRKGIDGGSGLVPSPKLM